MSRYIIIDDNKVSNKELAIPEWTPQQLQKAKEKVFALYLERGLDLTKSDSELAEGRFSYANDKLI